MKRPTTFLFVGVGGQGVLSAARLLGDAAFATGLDVSVSQLHGMSQRGGSVQAAVTVGGARLFSDAEGPVDVLIGLELIEAVRVESRLGSGSVALCNQIVVPPGLAALHRWATPELEQMRSSIVGRTAAAHWVDGSALARRAGHRGALSAVMLGALCSLRQCPVSDAVLLAALLDHGSRRSAEYNRRAFVLGREAIACAH